MYKLYYLSFIISLAQLLFSGFAFSIDKNNNIHGSYITIKYQPTISNFKNFHIKETDFDTEDPIGFDIIAPNTNFDFLKHNYNFSVLYHKDSYKFYENDLSGLALSIGLLVKNLRIEFEGSYKNFDTKRLAYYHSREGHKFFAIPRTSNFGVIPNEDNYTVAKNNGISIISNIINLCSETKFKNFTPYICLGIGGDFIEIFDVMRVKFTYQGKVGISYPITPKLVLSISGQYHKVIGNKFKFLPLIQPVALKRTDNSPEDKDVTALLTLDLEHFSSEIGLSFIF
ncbi:P44/Msp2 family outer membrane protein [Ehrlichia canis]|uniref:Surface antigen msp4 n=2 Tax=Ehrlichia canis TaxID=944 RepID=A0ACA6AX00_EHRCJ|nr:P44/Msp2 family outer membrane protein [Ehrlichia canis]AAK28684.1 major outer membrane protein P30-16 [Ehrlichia canis]AAZ68930.1 Surface antigen msp4 [Ehrlichia canis str. Jake]